MKAYPSIDRGILHTDVYAFDKLDGSNIRAEWSAKRGFYKFGTRKQMIDENHEHFGEAARLIRSKYEKDISDIMRKERLDRGVFFFEYFGPNSFAGWHDPMDIKDVVLFDVDLYKVGLIQPKVFLKTFGKLHTPTLVWRGNSGPDFVKRVKEGTLDGVTFEGVVCKAPHPKYKDSVLMFKIKSDAWLDRLKQKCGEDEKLFAELA